MTGRWIDSGRSDGDDALVTEVGNDAHRADAAPVLILIGDAALGGAPTEPRFVSLDERGLAIGRLAPEPPGAPAWRLTHRRASGRHARLQLDRGRWLLEDLGSTNGTFRNGARVDRPTELVDGDVLLFGGHAAVFRLVGAREREALEECARAPLGPFATASPAMALAESRLRRLAPATGEILLVGETGVGKEVYARAVHEASGRTGRFVAVNCAALPHELIESELFGYTRGAHSQAAQAKRGLIEEAEGGTLFLDEIGDMGHGAQAKLLRFLQTRELLPLGATRARPIDVRILAATSQFQASDGDRGLRADLVGRMGAAAIVLPPLRARREDLGALMAAFQRRTGTMRPLEPSLFMRLCQYEWPRNVRELEKVVETAALLAAGASELTLDHVPDDLAGRAPVHPPTELREVVPVAEPASKRRPPRPVPTKDELERALREHNGSVAEVARALDRQWRVVKDAMKRYGLDPTPFRR